MQSDGGVLTSTVENSLVDYDGTGPSIQNSSPSVPDALLIRSPHLFAYIQFAGLPLWCDAQFHFLWVPFLSLGF